MTRPTKHPYTSHRKPVEVNPPKYTYRSDQIFSFFPPLKTPSCVHPFEPLLLIAFLSPVFHCNLWEGHSLPCPASSTSQEIQRWCWCLWSMWCSLQQLLFSPLTGHQLHLQAAGTNSSNARHETR